MLLALASVAFLGSDYCLRFETSLFVASCDSQVHGGGIRTRLHTGEWTILQSQSHFTTGGLPPISSSWRQAPWDSRPVFFSELNICGHSPYVTSSLTRGWVCRFSCCWSSPGHSFSGPSPVGLMTTFYSLGFETPPTWSPGPRVYIPQKQGGPVIPQALCSLSVAFYNPQGYGGGDSNPSPHPGGTVCYAFTHKSMRTEYKTPPPIVPPLFAFVFFAAQARIDRVESHVTTDGQSASPPVKKALIWGLLKDLHHCQRVTGTLIRPPHRREDGSSAHNRCRTSPAQAIWGPSLAGLATTLHRLRFDTSLFVAFHDSRGHGGCTRHRLHMGLVISIIFKVLGPACDTISCVSLFMFD
jgi:hypothetical protein